MTPLRGRGAARDLLAGVAGEFGQRHPPPEDHPDSHREIEEFHYILFRNRFQQFGHDLSCIPVNGDVHPIAGFSLHDKLIQTVAFAG